MIRIRQAVIVEGKYDQIRLSSLVDTVILTTEGFGVFKDKEKQKLLRRLAYERGLVVLTDSDSAGFVIRSFLNGIVEPQYITNVYIPDVFGKEKRKAAPSKEGKLGVEGMRTEQLLEAFRKAGVTAETGDAPHERREVTKTDLYEDGLSGGQDSARKRRRLLRALDFPERMNANAMLKLINTCMTYAEYKAAVERLAEEEET
ncbi:MAG TPA: DUF4093 domain-containing protein [Candidatus Fimenecus stercoravium]|nr:DUF4093 domain-containing protein [Candidatus Fimenecus stercoravium]